MIVERRKLQPEIISKAMEFSKPYILTKQTLRRKLIMKKPTPNQKKAVFNNQNYRSNRKTRNTFYGRHDLLKHFHVTDKRKSWKEEI